MFCCGIIESLIIGAIAVIYLIIFKPWQKEENKRND